MSKRDEARDRWAPLVARYERAGGSQATFAAQQKVELPALRYWIYKLRGEAAIRPVREPEVQLLPVEVAGLGLRGIEVRMGQVSISLPAGTAAAYVAELASALGQSRC